ncbi:MAG: T9SS C-terminal target domain-containing protein [Saprospirales bacterium]|nr:MAG: T9SS C-terminal target domain-containing protein [Saprospirales bacterium]
MIRRLLLIFAFPLIAFWSLSAQVSDLVKFQIVPEVEGAFATYHFHVGGFQGIVGAQGTFTWDPDSMQFLEISHYGLPGLNSSSFNTLNAVEQGWLLYSWFYSQPDGVVLDDCDIIFSVRFAILEGPAEVNSSDEPLAIEFININWEPVEITALQVEVCDFTSSQHSLKVAQSPTLYPNPVFAGEKLEVNLPTEASSGSWKLYNSLGQVIDHSIFSTIQNLSIQLSPDLLPGLYLLKLLVGNNKSTHRLLIQ